MGLKGEEDSSEFGHTQKHEQLPFQTYITQLVVTQVAESSLGTDKGHPLNCKRNY